MPTADEFIAAARRYEEAARAARAAGRKPQAAFGSRVMWGGRLTAEVSDFVEETRSRTGVDAAAFDSLAAECRRRAGVVRQADASWDAYDRDYAAYERQVKAYNDGQTNTRPTPPSKPAATPAWVEL